MGSSSSTVWMRFVQALAHAHPSEPAPGLTTLTTTQTQTRGCTFQDGRKRGFDSLLLSSIRAAVSIPIIASSGAGKPEHFRYVLSTHHCSGSSSSNLTIHHRGRTSYISVYLGVREVRFSRAQMRRRPWLQEYSTGKKCRSQRSKRICGRQAFQSGGRR